jgi:NAD(P)-dependent dehydrogenase (short-subunit alcohol dehydrogenase family)
MTSTDLRATPLHDLLSLDGRSAVVTGGGQGIGAAVADRLSEAGARVYVADLEEERATTTSDALPNEGVAVAFDATDAGAHRDLAGRVVAETGRLDIWINNAGIYPFAPITDMTDEQWHAVIDLNLNGMFYGAREAASRMVEAGNGGTIVSLSSTAGYTAEGAGLAHYVSTKHAVRGLTKSLAVELGPHGIRALAVAPTLIETPGTIAQRDEISQNTGGQNPHEAFAAMIPLRRIGMPDDVARVVLFCVSGLAGFVSGDTILVDGGLKSL